LKTSDFDYHLPPDRIAQRPAEPRDSSRLLVLDRFGLGLAHHRFSDLPDLMRSGDALVLNDTRVLPARLSAWKIPGGGRAEILLLRPSDNESWEALVGGRGLRKGVRLRLADSSQAEILEVGQAGVRLIRFDAPLGPRLAALGRAPLPPYLQDDGVDPSRYQTVYARVDGSSAAPTAGLHFTPGLLQRLERSGIHILTVTLHIGLDTFAPVTASEAEGHTIHREWCRLSAEAADRLSAVRGQRGRIVAVGTTVVRTLESAARAGVRAGWEGSTDLFILPGFVFRAVDGLVTNFHLPRSTLLMLVSAFAGRERILAAYEAAKSHGYRFYSFGDAMLIL
jgi:S-adenosylmethionine:tRNA ribosyltransferase-isomerase